MKRKLGIGALILVAVLLIAVVAVYWYMRPLLLTATGYAAHNACALAHIADRDPNSDLPPNPVVPYLRIEVDEQVSGEVTHDAGRFAGARANILGVFAQQQAWYDPDFGCTVYRGKRGSHGTATPITPGPGLPTGASSPEVDRAIGTAFGDDLSPAEREALGARAVIVVHNGEIIGERYADGFTADTPQLGWSMTKSVTNLLTGRLVHQGVVAIDNDHLRPEWTDQRAQITIDDLMRMTSGLEWDETYDLGTPITRMLYLERDMAGYVAGLPSAHAPGEYQQYSTGSTTLLCSVLGERLDASGPDWPRSELFEPLGLSSAVLEADGVGNPACGSYLWATPRDWAGIGQFVLQDGVWQGERLLPEGWLAASTALDEVAVPEPGYGAGWWVNKLPDGSLLKPDLPEDTYWAQGHDGQRLYVVPSADLVVLRMGFSANYQGDDLRTDRLVADVMAAVG